MLRLAGLFIMALGLMIRIAAKKTLGKNWSYNKLSKPSKIESHGMYKYVRHPSYLGAMLIILGSGLIDPVIGLMFIALGFYESRIMDEETVLMYHYPEYKKYKDKTGALVPKIKLKGGNNALSNNDTAA